MSKKKFMVKNMNQQFGARNKNLHWIWIAKLLLTISKNTNKNIKKFQTRYKENYGLICS